MNWRHLELLRLVVETGSLTAAARAAGVSQPAVSQAMAALARQAGEPLFVRQGRGLAPTARARAWAASARQAEQARQQITQALVSPVPAPAQSQALRVGLSPAAGLLYATTIAQALAQADPQQQLQIGTGAAQDMLAQLGAGALDLVIAPRPRGAALAGLAQRVLYVSHPQVYGRVGHPLARATSLREIAAARWAVAGSSGTPGNVVEEAFRVRRWKPPAIQLQCADYAVLIGILAGTDLLGVIPHPRLIPEPQRQGLVALPVAEGLPHYEVCLFWRMGQDGAAGPVLAQVLASLHPVS